MEVKKVGNLTESFAKDALNQKVSQGPSFNETLENLKKTTAGKISDSVGQPAGVKFSNHAIERMQNRGIRFNPEELQKISEAVGKAASKGSRDSLILMNDSALIVSVKNNTVVTVMDKAALKENVFTNIDSTIVM